VNDVAKKQEPQKQELGGLRLALDYIPLVIFFGIYKYYAPADAGDMVGTLSAVIRSTGAFVAANIAAMIIARWKLGKVSPMMWLTTILVVGFGGLTVYFHDARFIQIKPTIIYVLLSALLFGGLLMKKPLLKFVFEGGYDGLSDIGWTILSRNWAIFFAVLAVLNEIVRAQFDFGTWLSIKVWGVTILSLLFGMANIPMLMKHGLGDEEPKPAGLDAG
jgi:intracellular septation protein